MAVDDWLRTSSLSAGLPDGPAKGRSRGRRTIHPTTILGVPSVLPADIGTRSLRPAARGQGLTGRGCHAPRGLPWAVSHLPARIKALGTKVPIWSSFGPWSLKSRGATLTWEETKFHSGNFNTERT